MDRRELVNRSMDYIMQHLEEDLTLDTVAAHVFLSKYHFSRIFKAETGETVHSFIRRCRVDQSAVDMKLSPAKAITDIGLDYGYSASNYSTLFQKRHCVAPTVFQKSVAECSRPVPFAPERVVSFRSAEEYAARIECLELEDLFVLYERFIGTYADLEQNWRRFLERYKGRLQEKTVLLERFFHDPAITGPSQCVYDLCMTADPACGLDNTLRLRGGKWLVYHFDGEIKDIYETLQGIFTVWLPQSGYQMARRYGLNRYRRIDWERHSVAMDLLIPIS